MSVEMYLARRYLLDRRHGAWGRLISLLTTGSVALGVAALIVTLAIMTGFREDIRQKLLGIHPHVFIYSFSGKLNPKDSDLNETLQKNKSVQTWSPFISGQVLIGRGKFNSGATIKGIDPLKEPQVANLTDRLIEGRWDDLQTTSNDKPARPRVILGQELARNIGARVGDVVWFVTPNSIGISAMSVPKAHLFEVSGLLQTGLYDYDTVLAYTNLEAAQNLFGMEGLASGVGVRIENAEEADQLARDIRIEFEGAYWVRSWLSQNKNLFSALKTERIVMSIILGLLTVVAAFMIVSILLFTITQRIKEIGILRAMGANAKTIHRIFLYQGVLMGLVGNAVGVVLGLVVSLVLAKTDLIQLPADVYYIDRLPIRLVPIDIITVVAVAAAVVLLATLYPSHKASKFDPIEAIRYG